MKNFILRIFPALSSPNYRLYFVGQLISMIGNWMQIVAQGWLVLQLTNSPFLIGLVAAAATAPALLFALFAGVLVDKTDRRKILITTQACSMVLALTLGVLAISGHITVWQIAIIAFLLGTVNAIDIPARQSFVVEMVGKDLLPSAISLNSGIFNAARVIGPSIAGFLIAAVGTGGAFIANGLTYIAVITAMLMINVVSVKHRTPSNPLRAIQEGVVYAAGHPIIRVLLLFTAVTSMFGWSYTTIMPVIARETYQLDASGLGLLFAASGLGALVAVVLVSAFSHRINPWIYILGGNMLFVFGMVLFSYSTVLYWGLIFLFLAGLGLLSQMSMMNTMVQSLVKDQLRGRVMSLYALMFMGLLPFGNLQVGYLTEHFGTGAAIRFDVLITFVVAITVLVYLKPMLRSYHDYRVLHGLD